jgi:hypothetical protein
MHVPGKVRWIASLLAISMAGPACSLFEQPIPSLTGPSSLSLALSVTASPDTLVPDGVSQSRITVDARDAHGRPIADLVATLDLEGEGPSADLGRLSARLVSTGVMGQGTVVYTAPRARRSAAERIVSVRVVVVGTNFGEALPRIVRIRLRSV